MTLKPIKQYTNSELQEELEESNKMFKDMNKEEIIWRFKTERTRIISEMLDNPDNIGLYPTSKAYEALDKLCEECMKAYGKPKQDDTKITINKKFYEELLLRCSIQKT